MDQEMGLDRKIYGEDRHVMVGIGKYMVSSDMLWLGYRKIYMVRTDMLWLGKENIWLGQKCYGWDRKIYGENRNVMVGIGKYMVRTDFLWLG